MSLTGNGLDLGILEQLLDPVDVEVGDTNVLNEALLDELLHLAPGGEDVVGKLAVGDLATVLVELGLLRRPAFGLGGALGDEGDRPVHEVKVEVLEAEVLEGLLAGKGDILGLVVELEELGGDPKLLTGDTGLLDTGSNLVLVLVGPGGAAGQRVICQD